MVELATASITKERGLLGGHGAPLSVAKRAGPETHRFLLATSTTKSPFWSLLNWETGCFGSRLTGPILGCASPDKSERGLWGTGIMDTIVPDPVLIRPRAFCIVHGQCLLHVLCASSSISSFFPSDLILKIFFCPVLEMNCKQKCNKSLCRLC